MAMEMTIRQGLAENQWKMIQMKDYHIDQAVSEVNTCDQYSITCLLKKHCKHSILVQRLHMRSAVT